MTNEEILRELVHKRDSLNQAIEALGGEDSGASYHTGGVAVPRPTRGPGSRFVSNEARLARSEKMRLAWARRKAGQGAPAPPAQPPVPVSEAAAPPIPLEEPVAALSTPKATTKSKKAH